MTEENPTAEIWYDRAEKYIDDKRPRITIHSLEHPNNEARFAFSCIERWAMIAAEPDGNDEAGRAKVRRMEPKELVAHAFETAHLAFEEARERGWLIPGLTREEIEDKFKEQDNAREGHNG